ncbi:protein of unknown function [Formivibrio citricus]|uniref:DnaJ homologue subfamily C member 28 conserved domain-containing protein n=1 Tax=Formivibrio citricus TaxID=83765 RepID=A0A1I5B6E1_9NEIS|nr:DnaJ family domain-containing protein [Formivibrio citricus]SFN70264.1 protein of unknown function [Formivibrio citricus]
MWFMAQLAEKRIEEARDRGDLDNLPGAGQPLQLDDDPLVPEHQRMAYRILKNSGYLPPELEMHKEAVEIVLQLAKIDAGAEKVQLLDRLARINLWLAETGKRQLVVDEGYAERVAQRVSAPNAACDRLS